MVEPLERARVSVRLLCLRNASEAPKSREPRLRGRVTALKVFVSGFVEMAGDLLVQLVVELARTHQPADARQEQTQASHHTFSGILRNRATIPVACCHAASSADSCLRPAFVNR